jgi:VWFA-related protein
MLRASDLMMRSHFCLTIFARAARLGGALALFCLAVAAQQAQAQGPGDEDIVRVDSSLVQLNIGVADRQGRPITDLSRNDFTIYEDGVRQTIIDFEPTQTPFSVVLLLDMSGSTLNFRQTLKQTALRFIDALGPADRICVIAFNDRIETLAGFTTNREKIAYAISIAGGRGETRLYDALEVALKHLASEGKRRKAIVVLTDGMDTKMRNLDRAAAAAARTNEEAVAAIKPEASAELIAALDAADRQGVTIYPLALPSGDPKRIAMPTPVQVAIYTAARARIQMLADRTGGRLSEIERLDQLGRIYAEVAAEMRTLYSVTYQPTGGRQRDGRWRSIRIEVARPDLIARTRPGYYAR